MGDIHGAYRAMLQCFERSGFNREQDTLIALGDVCDGWSEVDRCIDLLLTIPRLHFILGNHDYWAIQWAQKGQASEVWLQQGGQATVDAYPGGMQASHLTFLQKAQLYFIHQQNIFVHAGIDPERPIEQQDEQVFLWDRSLCNLALGMKHEGREMQWGGFNEIYIGHTPTIRSGYSTPLQCGNVWMMDTGAAWDGRLSLMDVNSKQYFQSDPVPGLYPGEKGRF